MDDRTGGIPGIIEAIASRTEADSRRMASRLIGRSWPGDVADRRHAGAMEWLRRWGPGGPPPPADACTCAAGRCPVCN
jgi:hypothetical protein